MKILSYNIHHSSQEKIDKILSYDADINVIPELACPKLTELPNNYEQVWQGVYESNLPEVLNELLYSNTKSQRVQATGSDLIHETMIEVFAQMPNSAFKWNWSKWRYDCVIDGNKIYATLSEYFGSRRSRIRDGKV